MDRSQLFDQDFEAILADTEAARRIHHKIRYDIYCEETGFEDCSAYPDRLEQDRWDENSVAFLIRAKQTGEWAGTLRLILPGSKLPSENFSLLEKGAVNRVKHHQIAELSRLCVVASFRERRRSNGGIPIIRKPKNYSMEIILGLLRAAAAYSREHNIYYWYFLTTRAMARLMSRLHFPLQPIGESIQHRGERFPYLAHIDRTQDFAKQQSIPFAKMVLHPTPYRLFSELEQHATDVVPHEAIEKDIA